MVASLGFPWTAGGVSREFKHLSPSLVQGQIRRYQTCLNAVALDEYRRLFSLKIWYLSKDSKVAKTIDLQQCWFPGAHHNVGGGYHNQALADLSFFWMLDHCRLFLNFNPKYIKYVVDTHYQPSQLESISGRPSRLEHADGYDMEHQGWGCGRCYNSYWIRHSWMWKYRTPGAYGDDDEETKETIHPSVRVRGQSSRENGGELKDRPGFYSPKALRGFEPREGTNWSWEWVKKEKGRGSGDPRGSIPG
ncbi:hypothetical protein GYMLUDRAFT_249837 [Collybiopsis luxurians FD-317 M1]|uniref:Unplaced genomic scaffold GYMLUscaffold_72, whole genome shotgun sequence n=1 Tax=Collybiopsis luxurians FD-317 M1 TaxID=944289 RepID=A0A0D0C832_9AGAR|nr:hypothetical protein GYMLUDRAFT_249837 [Collybiopsis luxurians FD-317 M1]